MPETDCEVATTCAAWAPPPGAFGAHILTLPLHGYSNATSQILERFAGFWLQAR